MAQISTIRAVALLDASATTLEDGERYVQTEIGYKHDWMPFSEAVHVVEAADGVFLRPNEALIRFRLMAMHKGGYVVRFEIDVNIDEDGAE